jgi:hypothetical protein
MHWLKSSYSEASANNCVELAATRTGTIALRESESPAHVITTDRAALGALVRGVQAGEFTTPRA